MFTSKNTLLKLVICCGAIILSFSFLTASAQKDFRPGYVVNTNGDTTRGLCLFKIGSGKYAGCEFKKIKDDNPQLLKEDRIKGYGFDKGASFVYDNTLTSFVEVLAWGKASLIKLNGRYFLLKESTLHELLNTAKSVTQPSGITFRYEAKEYQGLLNWLLPDCPTVSKKLGRTEFTDRSLTRIVDLYNACFGGTRPISHSKKGIVLGAGPLLLYSNVTLTRVSPTISVSQETLGVKQYLGDICDPEKLKHANTFAYGAFVELTPSAMGEKFAISIEALKQQLDFNSSILDASSTYSYSYTNELKENVSCFRASVYFKYNFKKAGQKFYPFFYMGPIFNTYHSKSSQIVLNQWVDNGISYHDYQWNNILVTQLSGLGWGAGAGINAGFGRCSARLSGRLENGHGPFEFSSYTSLSVALGLSYKL